MASLTITTRQTTTGPRYVVRYRLGGRAWPIVHAGSFRTLKEAKARRDLVAGEIAAARNPADALRQLVEPSTVRTFAQWAEAYRSSRVDYADETSKNLGSHLKSILPVFGDRDPASITIADVQEWIGSLTLKPSSISRYIATLRQILDFADVDPNPARDKRVKLPAIIVEEPNPPTGRQFLAILDASPSRWLLPFVTIEQTAMTVGETQKLQWGDVDVAERKFRLRRSTVKGQIRARARWVQVPAWLMNEIELSCPLEDRSAERQVFPGFTPDVAKNVIGRACKAAGIGHFHPHDLRHRRITIWHHEGIPARVLAERAGHARASMSLDVYSHVMRLEECDPAELQTMIVNARLA